MQRFYFVLSVCFATASVACDRDGPIDPIRDPNDILVADTLRLDALDDTVTAELSYPDASLNWQTADPSIASVTDRGLITAHRVGRTRVIARTSAGADTVLIDVRQVPVRVDVSPGADTLLVGGSAALDVQAFDANDNPIESVQVSWRSRDTTVVEAGFGGLLWDASPGQTNVVAVVRASTPDSATGESTIFVSPNYPRANFTQFSMGRAHVCALTASGAAYCWGSGPIGTTAESQTCRNFDSRITGNPSKYYDVSCFTTPKRVAGPAAFISIDAGSGYTCAIDNGGQAYCWGNPLTPHALGFTPTQPITALPRAVETDQRFRVVSTWSDHTCAVTTGSEIYCWGSGDRGQLGIGFLTQSSLPIRVSSSVAFTAVTLGDAHTCALAADSLAYCWGTGQAGQLGFGGVITAAASPEPVFGNMKFAAITAGATFTCGLTPAGKAYCWGSIVGANAPVPFRSDETWISLRAGINGLCGVRTDGTAWCEGFEFVEQTVFREVEGSRELTWSPFERNYCGLRQGSNELHCWGYNNYGEVGDGSFMHQLQPKPVYGGDLQ